MIILNKLLQQILSIITERLKEIFKKEKKPNNSLINSEPIKY